MSAHKLRFLGVIACCLLFEGGAPFAFCQFRAPVAIETPSLPVGAAMGGPAVSLTPIFAPSPSFGLGDPAPFASPSPMLSPAPHSALPESGTPAVLKARPPDPFRQNASLERVETSVAELSRNDWAGRIFDGGANSPRAIEEPTPGPETVVSGVTRAGRPERLRATGSRALVHSWPDAAQSPESSVELRRSNARLHAAESALAARFPGAESAVAALFQVAGWAMRGASTSVMLSGPAGSGKTTLARAFGALFGDGDAVRHISGAELAGPNALVRLLGTPPGYMGFGFDEPLLSGKPGLLIIDEVDHMHPDAVQILLQVLDGNHILDARGRPVDLSETMIVFTADSRGLDSMRPAFLARVGRIVTLPEPAIFRKPFPGPAASPAPVLAVERGSSAGSTRSARARRLLDAARLFSLPRARPAETQAPRSTAQVWAALERQARLVAPGIRPGKAEAWAEAVAKLWRSRPDSDFDRVAARTLAQLHGLPPGAALELEAAFQKGLFDPGLEHELSNTLSIYDVGTLDGQAYAATKTGFFLREGGEWKKRDDPPIGRIRQLLARDGVLLAATKDGLFAKTGGPEDLSAALEAPAQSWKRLLASESFGIIHHVEFSRGRLLAATETGLFEAVDDAWAPLWPQVFPGPAYHARLVDDTIELYAGGRILREEGGGWKRIASTSRRRPLLGEAGAFAAPGSLPGGEIGSVFAAGGVTYLTNGGAGPAAGLWSWRPQGDWRATLTLDAAARGERQRRESAAGSLFLDDTAEDLVDGFGRTLFFVP